MAIDVKNKNGIRYGEAVLSGISVRLPTQAETSTNYNHAKDAHVPSFDFKTKLFVVIERSPRKLLTDAEYRKRRIGVVQELLQKNSDKISVFELNGSKNMEPTKDENLALIRFQLACGFTYVTTFFGTVKFWSENFKSYKAMMPDGVELVPVIDLNLEHEVFVQLYELALLEKCSIVGFMGRKLSKNNLDNQLNFEFLHSRKDDAVVRFALSIAKSNNGLLNTLVYLRYRFDACSFLTRYGNQNVSEDMISALKGAEIEISQGRELVYIFLILEIPSEPNVIELRVPVVAPTQVVQVRS